MARPTAGPALVVVVPAAVIVRVAEDGVARHDVERQRLARQPRRGGERDDARDPLREARMAQVSAWCPPIEPPTTASSVVDAEVVEQPALHLDHVADGDGREVAAVRLAGRRVDRCSGPVVPRQPPRRFGQMTKYRSVSIGLARADDDVPPAGIVVGVVPGHVRVAAEGVADQHGVVARGVEPAVGLVGDRHARQLAAQLQAERSRRTSRSARAAAAGRGGTLSLSNAFAEPGCRLVAAARRSLLRRLQRLVQVGDDVAHVLDADRQADELRRHAGLRLLLGRQLRVRRRGRVDDQRLGVADVGQVAGQLDAVDELDAGRPCRP